jgi:hypothetical protein
MEAPTANVQPVTHPAQALGPVLTVMIEVI